MPYDLASARRAIRAECNRQGIDDEARRAMMMRLAGVSSSKVLKADGARAILRHLKKTGGDRPGHPGAPATLDREPYLQKIEALLADMAAPWAYAEAIARNITGGNAGGIERLAWVRKPVHLRGIVAALAVEKKKRLAKAWAALDEQLAQRGLDREWCRLQACELDRLSVPWPWHECLDTLRLIAARLP